MPALPPVPNVIRARFIQTIGTDTDVLNHIYLQYTGTNNQAAMNALAAQVATAWNAKLAGNIPNTVHLTGIQCQDLTSATGFVGVTAPGTNGSETTTSSTSANSCLLTVYEFPRRYRGGKPRWYQSGLSSTHWNGINAWATSFLTTWVTAFEAMIADIVGFSSNGVTIADHVNVSYYEGYKPTEYPSGRYRNVPQVRATPLVDIIGAYVADALIASQRRRTRGPS
jgi:hypothetical protein